MSKIFLLDNNCLNRLLSSRLRHRLRANLCVTGREVWPTAMNVLEILKSRDREKRTQFLEPLAELARDNLALTLPTEGLRRIAEAVAYRRPEIDWSAPEITRLFRDPASVTDAEAAATRDYLTHAENSFNATHRHASQSLRPMLKAEGGMERWPTVRTFLDDVWTRPEHLRSYVDLLWELWKLPGRAPFEELLDYDAWRLFFDGWGATVYERQIVHPQRRKVQHSDLVQLVYMGPASGRVLATGDEAFRRLGNEILTRSYPLARIVTLDDMIG